jgi:hypothetical protein
MPPPQALPARLGDAKSNFDASSGNSEELYSIPLQTKGKSILG